MAPGQAAFHNLLVLGGAGALLLIQYLWLGQTAHYADLLANASLSTLARNAGLYVGYVFWFFTLRGVEALQEPAAVLRGATVALAFGLCVLVGFAARSWRQPVGATARRPLAPNLDLPELFLLGYLVVIIVMPYLAARYLLPIFPLLVLYAGIGAGELARRLGARPASGWATLGLVVTIVYLPLYPQLDLRPSQDGVASPASIELFAHIRSETPTEAVVIFPRPRAMALFGERGSAIWPEGADHDEAWRYMRQVGATHLVVGDAYGLEYPGFLRDRRELAARHDVVFDNRRFVVYQLRQATPAREVRHAQPPAAPRPQ